MNAKRLMKWVIVLVLLSVLPVMTVALAQDQEPAVPDLTGETTEEVTDVNAPEAGCIPRPKEVAVFLHEQYGGTCKIRKVGRYPNAAAMGMADNSITAIKVGSQARIVLFRDKDFKGVTAAYLVNAPNLGYDPIGNDTVSSFKVELRAKTGCVPNNNQIALFEHINYGGQCVLKDVGNYRNALEIGLPDNLVSSVKVGARLRLVLYRDNDFGGVTGTYLANDSSFGGDPIGNDTVSSIRVDVKMNPNGICKPKPNQIALFEHINYGGRCVVKEIGDYPNDLAVGLPENLVTSIKVGAAVWAVLYDGQNFTGGTATVLSSDPNLSDTPIGHDSMSSLKVYSD